MGIKHCRLTAPKDKIRDPRAKGGYDAAGSNDTNIRKAGGTQLGEPVARLNQSNQKVLRHLVSNRIRTKNPRKCGRSRGYNHEWEWGTGLNNDNVGCK